MVPVIINYQKIVSTLNHYYPIFIFFITSSTAMPVPSSSAGAPSVPLPVGQVPSSSFASPPTELENVGNLGWLSAQVQELYAYSQHV